MCADRSYQDTIAYLFALQKHGIKLGLANTRLLMQLAGDPCERFRSVHVSGTNGKGSTSAFLAAVLTEAGYRVGLYTSPHLVDFTERIRINGRRISEARVVEIAGRLRREYEPELGGASPTFFEVTTAIAFTYFAEEGVDFAVVEVGMGGRLDSTNVITPLVSVITTIDLEHTEFLGDTLELIAAEKAGIIKQGVPVVTGVKHREALSVIERKAGTTGSPVYLLGRDFLCSSHAGGKVQQFDYRGIRASLPGAAITLHGRYQQDNACVALAALECMRTAGVAIDEGALRRGLKQARWEGRLERVATGPDIYLDGAHNPASAAALAGALRELRTAYRRVVLVIGILADKDVRSIVMTLVPLADRVIVTKPAYSRALDLDSLAGQVRMLHDTVSTAGTVGQAIDQARELAGPDDLILVTGSLYVVGDARAAILGNADGPSSLSGLKG